MSTLIDREAVLVYATFEEKEALRLARAYAPSLTAHEYCGWAAAMADLQRFICSLPVAPDEDTENSVGQR